MAITAAQLNIRFNSEGASQVKGDLKDVGGAVSNAESGFGKLKGAALGMGTALIVPMGIGLKAAIDLEQSIANVNASLGGLDSGTLDALSASFQQIGADSQFSATEVALVADELAKAGYGAEDLLGGMTQAVVDLSQATGEGLSIATTGITQSMAMWGEEIVGAEGAMTDASVAADILTNAANESAGGVESVIGGMRNFGPSAASMGMGFDEASAAIALFTNYGYSGSEAGTKLSRAIQFMAAPTDKAAKLMAELGISAFDSSGQFKGMPALFDNLQSSMSGMSDEAQAAALKVMFGAEAYDAMLIAVQTGGDPLREMTELMNQSGAAAEQSALRMDTLGAQFDTLKEGVTTFLGSLVQGLIPGMRFLVDGANSVIDVLMKIPGPIKTIIGAVAGGLAAFAAITQAMRAFSAVNMLLNAGGPAKGFALPLGPILAFAAAAGLAYIAYRKNFLGIRDIVDDVLDGITDFVDNVMDAWDDLGSSTSDAMGTINEWGGVASDVATYANDFARGLGAVGTALRMIGGGRFDWINRIADGFDGAAKFVQKFVDTWNSFDANNGISDVMESVNDWGNKTAKQMGAFDRLVATLGKMGGAAKVLGGVLGFIGDHFNTIAKAVGIAVGAFVAFQAASGVIAIVAGAIALLTSPLFLVIAAVALLATAWIQNWGDIQGKTAAVVDFLASAFITLTGWAETASNTIRSAWDGISGGVDAAAAGVQSGVDGMISAWNTLAGAVDSVVNRVQAAWDRIQGVVALLTSPGDWDINLNMPDWNWPSLPDWNWPDWNWPDWSWPSLPDWSWPDLSWPDWSWPSLPTFSWPDLSWPDWSWPSLPTFSWPGLPTFSWPSLPSWSWPGLPAFSWPAWSWPSLPSFAWPSLPAFRWPEWSWPSLPSFAWPSLPSFAWPDWSWPSLPSFAWPDWSWPSLPAFSWPSLPTFSWPNLPSFSWPNLPSWTWPSFSWPALPTITWPTLPAFNWPSLPTWTWPGLPSFSWPAFPTITWPGLVWTWPALPTWAWPGLPSFSWPAFPTFEWPDIPKPGWMESLFGSTGSGDGLASGGQWQKMAGPIGSRGPDIGGAMSAGASAVMGGGGKSAQGAAFGASLAESVGAGFSEAIVGQQATMTTAATTASTAAGAAMSQGLLTTLPVFVTALNAYPMQMTTLSMTMTPAATAAGTATGAALAQGFLATLPVFNVAIQALPTLITTQSFLMTTAGTAAGTATGAAIAQGFLLTLPVFNIAIQSLPLLITTQSFLMTTAGTAAGTATGAAIAQGFLATLPVFNAAVTALSMLITSQGALMATAGTAAGQGAGAATAQGVLNTMGAFGASVAVWTALINGQAGPMGAAGLNAGSAGGYGAVNGLNSAAGSIAGAVAAWPGYINGIAGSMGAAGMNAGAAAGYGVANGLNSASGAVSAAADNIMSIVNGAMRAAARIRSPSKMTTEIGAYMGMGVAEGILGSASGVTGAAVSVVSSAIAAAREAAGIASPAKEMMPVGVHMDEGLAQGIIDGQGTVIAAAVQVAQAAVAASRQTMGGGLTGVYNDAARMMGREMGSMGGAIIQGWEKLTDGYWKSVSTGTVKKGILAEDNTYVNPGFYAAGLSAGNAFGDGVASGARSALQINSPSRVLSEMGKYSAQGFMRGIAKEYRDPELGFSASGSYSAGTSIGTRGDGGTTFAPVINITVDATGADLNEERLAEVVIRKIVPAVQRTQRQYARSMGG